MDDKYSVLKKVFGYDGFRPGRRRSWTRPWPAGTCWR